MEDGTPAPAPRPGAFSRAVESLLDLETVVFPADRTNPRAITRMADAVCQFPMDALASIDDWYRKFCGSDVKAGVDETELVAAIDTWHADAVGDAYISMLHPRLRAAANVASAWRALRTMMSTEGVLDPPTAVVDGRTRLFSPEGAALEAFLQHAHRCRWYVRGSMVMVEANDSAVVCFKPVTQALMDVALSTSPYISDYLSSRPGLVDSLTDTICSGCHDRCPGVEVDTTRIVFEDCVVRLTCMGLALDAPGSAVMTRSAAVSARASVPVPFRGDASWGSLGWPARDPGALVVRMFAGHQFALRVCGALVLPPPLRSSKWQFVVVATTGGVVGVPIAHPVEVVCRSLIGLGVTEGLAAKDMAMGSIFNTTTGPYCLLVRCGPTSELTHTQLTQIDMALTYNMSVVVLSPHVPTAVSQNPQLRLLSVHIEVVPRPEEGEIVSAALPFVLAACQAAYNCLPADLRDLQTPLFDGPSLQGRVNTTDLASPAILAAEMMQAEFGVRIAPKKVVDAKVVQDAFRTYQAQRGYLGLSARDLMPLHVIEAFSLLASVNPALRSHPVGWDQGKNQFTNLAFKG
jgi:hypothetical protein